MPFIPERQNSRSRSFSLDLFQGQLLYVMKKGRSANVSNWKYGQDVDKYLQLEDGECGLTLYSKDQETPLHRGADFSKND